MPDKASYKSKGGDKDSATKHTFNPPEGRGPEHDVDAEGTEAPDGKHGNGQFSGAGQAPIMKK